MRWLASLIVLFTLAGCGLARQAQIREAAEAASAQINNGKATCEQKHGTAKKVPVVKCKNAIYAAANAQYAAAGGNVFPDLVAADSARILVAAEKFDAGKITEGEYQEIVASSAVRYETEGRRRNAQAAGVAAQQQAAAAQQSQAAIARGRAIQDAFNPRTQTTNTNCNSVGNSVNCRSTSY